MSDVWSTLIDIEQYFESKFQSTGTLIEEPGCGDFKDLGLIDKVWTSSKYRRARIDIIDARETRGVWMMHCTVSPHLDNPAPIFGFDVVAGKNKITGCFIDYSPTDDKNHPMIDWFGDEVKNLEWRKVRTLPEWAQRIFSKHMIAAGTISDANELDQVSELAKSLVDHYLETVEESAGLAEDTTASQNFYCQNQKLNPHNARVMASLGIPEHAVQDFIDNCLFPEIR